MLLEGQHIAFLVGPGFEDLEFWAVYMRLIEEGARVTTVGVKAGERHASKSGGLFATADVAASAVSPDQFDAIVVPGGWAPDKIRRYEAITGLVKGICDQGKIVGMICHAGLVGISARIVAGSRATGSLGIKDDLVNAGAKWEDKEVVVDDNLVTSRTPADLPAFMKATIKQLQLVKV